MICRRPVDIRPQLLNKIRTPAQPDALLDIGAAIHARLGNPLAEHSEKLVGILPVLLMLPQDDAMAAKLKMIQVINHVAWVDKEV